MLRIYFEEQVQEYFEGWNQHRPDLVTSLFSNEGTFEDPICEIVSSREPASDISVVMNALASVFPDFKFEIRSMDVNHVRAFVEWTFKGTNTMSWKPGIDAMGKTPSRW
jgi:SnoaL-like protein